MQRPRSFLYIVLTGITLLMTMPSPVLATPPHNPKKRPPTIELITRDMKAARQAFGARTWRNIKNDDEFEKMVWLTKVVRVLRAGQGVSEGEDLSPLLPLSKAEVIERLMRDERFANALFDFNSYYVGARPNEIAKPDGTFLPDLLSQSQAVNAAREGFRDGDYFSLFNYKQPSFVRPLVNIEDYDAEPDQPKKTQPELRAELVKQVDESLSKAISAIEGKPDMPFAEFSKATEEVVGNMFNSLFTLGVFDLGVNAMGFPFYSLLAASPSLYDYNTNFSLLKELNRLQKIFFAEIIKYGAENYRVVKLMDAVAFPYAQLSLPDEGLLFNFERRQMLPNSSTNMNRKRAAYFLKTYFCDDLTPIRVENPGEHGQGRHGSDPACYACHYKLDPMAGFFRNIGGLFLDLENYDRMVFDDGASTNRNEYVSQWRAREGSGREWEVGYIRSSSEEFLNSYGSTPEDLFKIIREAPEVKRCLVRRLFEYNVAENQAVHGGYIDQLQQKLERIAKEQTSGVAIKAVWSDILQSQSFQNPDLVPDQCYDFPKNYNPQDAPPCRVAYVLQKNCVGCHHSTGSRARLDLSKWLLKPDGHMGFSHLGSDRQELPAAVTFERIAERISSVDPDRRMPLNSFMDAVERDQLYLWALEQVNQ